MGILSDLNEEIKNSNAFGIGQKQFVFKTDQPVFDYLNGQKSKLYGHEVSLVGLDAGKHVLIIGNPGSGKSSLAIQLAGSIMKKYDESYLYIYDFENSNEESRVKALIGGSDDYFDQHVVIKKGQIYTDTVLSLISKLYTQKMKYKKQLLIDNKEGILDENGKLVKILPPTFIIVDTLATMRTKDAIQADTSKDGELSLSSLTAGGRNAIMNKDFMVKTIQPCAEANIILILINQVSVNMSMGVTPPTSTTRYLKNTKAVSGGRAVQYNVNLFIEVEAGQKLDPNEIGKPSAKYGIKGFESYITIIKSRNSEAGKTARLIFSQSEGLDSDLSLFAFMEDNELFEGMGKGSRGMYLSTMPDIKFKANTIKDILSSNKEFKDEFYRIGTEALENSLSFSSKVFEKKHVSPISDDNSDTDYVEEISDTED